MMIRLLRWRLTGSWVTKLFVLSQKRFFIHLKSWNSIYAVQMILLHFPDASSRYPGGQTLGAVMIANAAGISFAKYGSSATGARPSYSRVSSGVCTLFSSPWPTASIVSLVESSGLCFPVVDVDSCLRSDIVAWIPDDFTQLTAPAVSPTNKNFDEFLSPHYSALVLSDTLDSKYHDDRRALSPIVVVIYHNFAKSGNVHDEILRFLSIFRIAMKVLRRLYQFQGKQCQGRWFTRVDTQLYSLNLKLTWKI